MGTGSVYVVLVNKPRVPWLQLKQTLKTVPNESIYFYFIYLFFGGGEWEGVEELARTLF